MSDEQKSTRKEASTPCGDMPFAAMMEKMMGQGGQACGCMAPGVMSQMMGQPGMDCDCSERWQCAADERRTKRKKYR